MSELSLWELFNNLDFEETTDSISSADEFQDCLSDSEDLGLLYLFEPGQVKRSTNKQKLTCPETTNPNAHSGNNETLQKYKKDVDELTEKLKNTQLELLLFKGNFTAVADTSFALKTPKQCDSLKRRLKFVLAELCEFQDDLVRQEHQQREALMLCVICEDHEKEIAFQPCGHVCACYNCAVQLPDCPICRVEYTDFLRVYL